MSSKERYQVAVHGAARIVAILTLAGIVTPALADETRGSPYLTAYVALLTGVLGFVGSWIGAYVALANFKRHAHSISSWIGMSEPSPRSM
jgi:hypothetical protein